MNGGVGLTGQSPWAAWMSVWHSPAVSTLTRTSPGPGSGLGTSSRLSGLVKSWTTAAFMGDLLALQVLSRDRSVVPERSRRTVGRDREWSQPDTHGLDLGVQIEDLVAHFAAPPGLLVAAEGQCGVEDVVAVDPDGAGVPPFGHAVGSAQVLGPDPGAESVDRVVGRGQHVVLPGEGMGGD